MIGCVLELAYKYYNNVEQSNTVQPLDLLLEVRIQFAILKPRISDRRSNPVGMSGTTFPGMTSSTNTLLSNDTSVKLDDSFSNIDVSDLFNAQPETDLLPIILILGPPGSGKGTLCKRLAAEFGLHHISVGDWLRDQAQPPIASVSERVNRYVFENEAIPEEVLQTEHGGLDNAPPALILYQCSKLNISTPESLKNRAMPALKEECERISTCSGVRGILIDNLQQNLRHCDAAAETFGEGFPTLLIAVDCADETAKNRFLGRGRGSDDALRFDRRIARFRTNYASVVDYFETSGCVVRVSTEADSDEAYQVLVRGLGESEAWRMMCR